METNGLTESLRSDFEALMERDETDHRGSVQYVYLFIHDYPDPDALASAAALKVLIDRVWGKTCLIWGTPPSRPQNKTLYNLLNMELLDPNSSADPEIADSCVAIMLDCNPGSGNIAYFKEHPDELEKISWVIDHHIDKNNPEGDWCDIASSTGSTCTRIVDYMKAFEFEWSEDKEEDGKLASAMMLGISVDTDGLKAAYVRDMTAYWYLREHYDVDSYDLLERAEIPAYYMDALHDAHGSRQQVGSLVVASVGVTTENRRDVLAFIADLWITVKDVNAVVIYGIISNKIMAVTRIKGRGPITAADLARGVFSQPDGGGRTSDKSDKSGVTVVLNKFFDMDLLTNGSREQFLEAIKAIIVARAKQIVDIDE
jgi:nanoRNase/pAp phosphatase (c-di-AMP/oligoRNAs hydrolase)